MYEVTSRKGGQRQQPYGRPCATVREVRDNSHTAMDLLDLHVHRLQKSPRVRQRSESNSKLDGCTAAAFLDFEKEKKRALAPAEGPGVWFAAKVAKGELNPVFFIFDPKTQKPNSAARPPLKSRRPTAKPGNQLGTG